MSLIFAGAAVAQAVLLAVVLFTTRRGHTTANRLLAWLMLAIGGMVGGSILRHSADIVHLPHLIVLYHPLDFVVAPLLFLYVCALTEQRELRRTDVLHFMPAVLWAVAMGPFFGQGGAAKLAMLDSNAYQQWYYVRAGLAMSIASVYVVLAVRTAVRHWRPNPSPQLRFLCVAFSAVLIVALVRYAVDLLWPAYMPVTSAWLPLMGTAVLCGMTYLGLRDPEDRGRGRKYETSSLTADRADRALQALQRALQQDEAYRDPEVTLNSLAARLHVPVPHLSQIINERLHQNFADLINGYRVEEAKRRLADRAYQHYSILAIAGEVGFRSKSSFNAVFKRHTQTTPSEFRKAALQGPEE